MGAREKRTVIVMLIGVAFVAAFATELHSEFNVSSHRTQLLMLASLSLGVMASCVVLVCIKFFAAKQS